MSLEEWKLQVEHIKEMSEGTESVRDGEINGKER